MRNENLSKMNKTIDSIETSIHREFESSIGKVIVRIFDAIIQPILNLIPKIVNKISRKFEQRKIKNTMKFAVNSNLLRNYLDKNNLDMIVLLTHNGKKSEAGVSYKYFKKLFCDLQDNHSNDLLNLLLNNSSQIDLFDDWLVNCEESKDIDSADFDNKLNSYFGEFAYSTICFRRYRTAFYLILCRENLPNQADEFYIIEQIEKLLQ
jgi:hypothetical protein